MQKTVIKEPLEQLLTPTELSELLRVSPKTIYHWVHRREIPYTRIGKHLRFSASEVVSYFKQKMGDSALPCPVKAPLVDSSRFRSLKNR